MYIYIYVYHEHILHMDLHSMSMCVENRRENLEILVERGGERTEGGREGGRTPLNCNQLHHRLLVSVRLSCLNMFKLLYQNYRLHPHFPQEMVPSQSGLPGMQ